MEDRKRKRAELKAQKELEDAMKPKGKYRKKVKGSPLLNPNLSLLLLLSPLLPPPFQSSTSPDPIQRSISPFGTEID